MDQSAQIRASMEGYALAIVGRLETKIGVEGGLQEASHDMFEISMCVDFGDADEGIVVAKFGADCIRRIAFAGWPTIANQELAAMDHGTAIRVGSASPVGSQVKIGRAACGARVSQYV